MLTFTCQIFQARSLEVPSKEAQLLVIHTNVMSNTGVKLRRCIDETISKSVSTFSYPH